jgi:hypothetical protein
MRGKFNILYHSGHKFLLRRLVLREGSKQRHQSGFACSVWFDFALVVNLNEVDAQIGT